MARTAGSATTFRILHSAQFAAVVTLVCFMGAHEKFLVRGAFPGGEPQKQQRLQRQQQLQRQQRQQQQHPQLPPQDQHQHSPQPQHDLEARRHASSSGSTQKRRQIGESEEQTFERTAADERETLREVGKELDEEEEEYVREEFAEYDANRDGLLDAYEISTTHAEIRSDELHHFFRAVDTNNDGLISLEEYRSFVETLP